MCLLETAGEANLLDDSSKGWRPLG
ncbi:MAG: hypothetical protein H7Y30_05160 [Pyrinomonadaceae bacterium]|nr:hypothetical protein [Pyrinomonadaceae bacterium]